MQFAIQDVDLNPQWFTSPQGTNPWMEGTEIISMPAPKDCYINMAMALGQNKPGGWGTFDNIPNVDYVRNELAVTPEFKTEVSDVQRFLISNSNWNCWSTKI